MEDKLNNNESELSESEINELNYYSSEYFIIPRKRKYYNLFVKREMFNLREQNIQSKENIPNVQNAQYQRYIEECFYIGYYYHFVEQDNNKMEKYYLIAINCGYSYAMFFLGYYYQKKEKWDLMKKYYLMAINKKNTHAMFFLGIYYYNDENIYMVSNYFLMCLENNIEYFTKVFIDTFGNLIYHNYKKFLIIIDELCYRISTEKYSITIFELLLKIIIKYLNSGGYKIYFSNSNLNPSNLNLNPNEQNEICIQTELDNLDIFLMYLSKIMYGKETEKRRNEKKIVTELMNTFPFITHNNYVNNKLNNKSNDKLNDKLNIKEILKLKYIEYLNSKFAPGGKGFIKAKKDFDERSEKEGEARSNEMIGANEKK
jgi:hypothetical protein